mmetsp:Transcript_18651/g.48381  ORF Transcript_18651/g.48381 Transcript_18651/m.48381 type:complete len:238 (+) Transcript_18651:130-843(+)
MRARVFGLAKAEFHWLALVPVREGHDDRKAAEHGWRGVVGHSEPSDELDARLLATRVYRVLAGLGPSTCLWPELLGASSSGKDSRRCDRGAGSWLAERCARGPLKCDLRKRGRDGHDGPDIASRQNRCCQSNAPWIGLVQRLAGAGHVVFLRWHFGPEAEKDVVHVRLRPGRRGTPRLLQVCRWLQGVRRGEGAELFCDDSPCQHLHVALSLPGVELGHDLLSGGFERVDLRGNRDG